MTERVGDFSQIAGAKRYELTCGKSKGVEAVDIRTGGGLNYTVLADRALDIGWAEYKGIPLVFMAQAGIVSPQYYHPDGNEWLRSFSGGLLTTCGLSNVGEASELNGVKYGQHGRISNLPGENISIEEEFDGMNYLISVKGKVRQVKSFVENMILQRTIKSFAGQNSILINDVVENRTTGKQPFMLLYHFNFGFPLLNENSRIIIPNKDKVSFEDPALFRLINSDSSKEDQEVMPEDPFLFQASPDKKGDAYFLLANDRDDPELAILLKYSHTALKNLILWKYLYSGNYVLCIEPANCHIKGIDKEYKNGTLEYLEPFEKREINIEIKVLGTREEILKYQNFLEKLD